MIRKLLKSLIVIVILSLFSMSGKLPVQRAMAQATSRENHLILLQYGEIDTSLGEPQMDIKLRLEAFPPGQPGYYIVQFTDVILTEWRASLEALGVEIMGYIPNNAYLVRMTDTKHDQVTGLANVQWVGIYQPAYRISKDFSSLAPTSSEQALMTVLTFPNAGLDAIVSQIKGLGAGIQAAEESKWEGTLRIQASQSLLPSIAKINGVMWIEPWYEPVLTNDTARGIMGVQDTVWATQGLYGSGQIVAVADTGLDVGTTEAAMNDDFEGRIHAFFARGRSEWNDPNGHGTHVAGSVLGNGRNSNSNPANHSYATSHAGIAPEAELVFQSTLSADGSLGGIPANLNTLFQQAYVAGARIHSNSWGNTSGFGNYTASSKEADEFVWDNPDMVILFSAGNEGTDADANGVVDGNSMTPPATAKNVITVGASESTRASGGYNPGGGL